MKYWLLKSEPEVYSLEDLARDGSTGWEGVRNYQARNNLRAMRAGDLALFYHSHDGAAVGLCRIAGAARPDPSQFDKKSPGYDPKSDPRDPRWSEVVVEFVGRLARPVTLAQVKADPALKGMELARRGRLSVQAVTPDEWKRILRLGGGEA